VSELSLTELIGAEHVTTDFDCGEPGLNEWLTRYALLALRSETARTYVTHRDLHVRGYYSLAVGSVVREEAPERVVRGTGRHDVPVAILARLAVDRSEQGSGLGSALLKDALIRVAHAADVIGVRAVLVHAKNDAARRFYERFDFEPSPIDDLRLFLLMKDLRKAIED